MQGRGFSMLGAMAIGLAITWVDSRPGWDDTGISAGMIFLTCMLLGTIHPKRAWQWALAVGIGIPLHSLFWSHNYGGFLALVPAFLGAYLGAGIRSWGSPPPSEA